MRWHAVAGGAGPASHGTTLFGAHATRKPTIVGRAVSAWIDKHEPEHINYFEWQRTVRGALNVQAELPTRATDLVKEFLDRTW